MTAITTKEIEINFSHRVPAFFGKTVPAQLLDIYGPAISRAKTMVEMLETAAQLNVDNGTYLYDHDVINLCGAIKLELQDVLMLLKARDEYKVQSTRSASHD
jgi:hypothetical protein